MQLILELLVPQLGRRRHEAHLSSAARGGERTLLAIPSSRDPPSSATPLTEVRNGAAATGGSLAGPGRGRVGGGGPCRTSASDVSKALAVPLRLTVKPARVSRVYEKSNSSISAPSAWVTCATAPRDHTVGRAAR